VVESCGLAWANAIMGKRAATANIRRPRRFMYLMCVAPPGFSVFNLKLIKAFSLIRVLRVNSRLIHWRELRRAYFLNQKL
jgi:hypothetical protein